MAATSAQTDVKKVVLAYSGSLATPVLLRLPPHTYACEVVSLMPALCSWFALVSALH